MFELKLAGSTHSGNACGVYLTNPFWRSSSMYMFYGVYLNDLKLRIPMHRGTVPLLGIMLLHELESADERSVQVGVRGMQ
jgi:hypothetical protein